jgi:hypothetical protein
MRRIPAEHVGAHDEDADAPGRARKRGQRRQGAGHAARHPRVVEADIRILNRRRQLARLGAAIAAGQHAEQVGQVLRRAGQPVLHRQHVGPHVLRGAGDEAQQLGELLEHLHLALARGGARLLRAAQLLQQGERPACLGRHVEAADARQLHYLARAHQADHRGAGGAPRLQRRQDEAHMLVEEQHGGHHDVRARDVGEAGGQRHRVVRPFISRVQRDAHLRQVPGEVGQGGLHRRGEMPVHGDDDDADAVCHRL